MDNGDVIYMTSNNQFLPGKSRGAPAFDPQDYGYSNGRDLANVLVPRFFQEFKKITFVNVAGSLNIDTAKQFYDTAGVTPDLIIHYEWDTDTITEQRFLVQ